jgi:CubicO group peptidase (beta-lactamase class C family)
MKAACWLACLCAATGAAFAANPEDDFLNSYIARRQIPGLAVLVRSGGKVVLSAGYGMANLEHGVRVTPETVFQSGSMGKQFTAFAVMILVEEHKLSLSDPIGKHLSVPPSWSAITVRHLLTHTSGLGDYPEDFSLRRDYTEADLLKTITEQPLAFAPGDRWSYSNLGYVTLGILVHQVSGKFYGDFLKERVFAPLGMKNTRIISEADIIPNRAAGYQLKDGVIKNQEWVSPTVNTTADGSLYVTVEDLAKWDAALASEKILSHASFEQIWTPVRLNDGSTAPYGFGWGIHQTARGHRLLEHGGAWQGFMTYIARYPDDGLTVVALCNMAGADPAYVAHRLAGFYQPELAPPVHHAIRVAPATLASYAGDYRLDDRLTLTVTASGERLVTTFLGQTVTMIPESARDFFAEDSERTFHFETDHQGRVTELIITAPQKLTFRRLP